MAGASDPQSQAAPAGAANRSAFGLTGSESTGAPAGSVSDGSVPAGPVPVGPDPDGAGPAQRIGRAREAVAAALDGIAFGLL
ncbi:hypothetical protein, partial [Cryobacterium sp. HLT2-28]|uniref:hypothetical protein n=1 Tax=Cryobacterium sp. HLT2-28 TaxID=1259146 RepID=UPI00351697BF